MAAPVLSDDQEVYIDKYQVVSTEMLEKTVTWWDSKIEQKIHPEIAVVALRHIRAIKAILIIREHESLCLRLDIIRSAEQHYYCPDCTLSGTVSDFQGAICAGGRRRRAT